MSYHCLKRYKDGGICQALTGKIFWSFVYVDDAESGWSRTEKEAQDRTNVSIGVQGVQTRLKRNVRFESK